jgi:hypothetical protein
MGRRPHRTYDGTSSTSVHDQSCMSLLPAIIYTTQVSCGLAILASLSSTQQGEDSLGQAIRLCQLAASSATNKSLLIQMR